MTVLVTGGPGWWEPDFSRVSWRQVWIAARSCAGGKRFLIVDEAPTSIYELVELVGETREPSSEP